MELNCLPKMACAAATASARDSPLSKIAPTSTKSFHCPVFVLPDFHSSKSFQNCSHVNEIFPLRPFLYYRDFHSSQVCKRGNLQIIIFGAQWVTDTVQIQSAKQLYLHWSAAAPINKTSQIIGFTLQHFRIIQIGQISNQLIRVERLITEKIKIHRYSMSEVQRDRCPTIQNEIFGRVLEFSPQSYLRRRQFGKIREKMFDSRITLVTTVCIANYTKIRPQTVS